jgi:hypothetical protein
MIWQARLAALFGGAEAYMYGDSNAEAFNTFGTMTQFDKLTVNFGVGGTTSHDWSRFMQTSVWSGISSKLTKATAIQNVGGNNALKQDMKYTQETFLLLKQFNLRQIGILVPPIYADVLMPLLPNLKKDIKTVNTAILNNNTSIIDPSGIVDQNHDTIPDPGKLSDLVHYSKSTCIRLVRVLNSKLAEPGR